MSSRDEGGEEGRDGKDGDGGGDEDGAGGAFEVCVSYWRARIKTLAAMGRAAPRVATAAQRGYTSKTRVVANHIAAGWMSSLSALANETAPRPEETGKPASVPPRTKRAQRPAVPPRRSVKFRTGVERFRLVAETRAPQKMATMSGLRASEPAKVFAILRGPFPAPVPASTTAMVRGSGP